MTLRKGWRGGAVLAGMLAVASGVHAQQTTAAIGGAVLDRQGAPVAAASVEIVHLPTGTRLRVPTDAAGVFDTRGLRVGGPYRVTVTAANYETQVLDNLYLAVGDLRRLTVTLVGANEVTELVVTGTKRTRSGVANVGSRTVVRAADIEAVVSIKRDIRDIGRRDPLAQLDFVNRSTGPSGGLYIAGSTPRSNRITIDGVRSQDDFGLNTGGLSTNRGPISLEAVEQATIQAVPFDVEEGDFTGGALNLILKSGGNDFHGTGFVFDRETRLAGNHVPITGFPANDVTQPALGGFKSIKNPIDEENYGFFLSGPIWRDRLFFAASYESFTSTDTTGYGPAGAGFANTFNAIPGVSAAGSNATAADIATVLANYNGYAASSVLKPGQDDLSQPIIDRKSSVKIDYNITDTQRLTGTYRHAESSVVKRSPNATTISLDSNWYSQPENEDNYLLQLNSQWSPVFSTEVRGAFRNYQRGQLPPEGQGFANLAICTDVKSVGTVNACSSGVPTINIGPDQFRQANALKTTDWTGEFIANYRLFDTHALKVGYQFKGIHVYDLFVQQAHGVYYFDSVADFAAGRASQLSYNSALSGNPTDAAERFSYKVHTLLAQDTWTIDPSLTASYGLRYDLYASDVLPTLNSNFVNRYGFNNQQTYDGRSVLMPRITLKYQASNFELSGGVGLVSGGIPDVFIGNSYGAQTGALTNGFVVRRNADGTFTETAANLQISPAQGATLLSLNKADPSFVTQASTLANSLVTTDSPAKRLAFTNSIAPGFNLPSDWKANVSFKTTVYGFDLGVDAVGTLSQDAIAFRDLRARLLTINGVPQYTPDGRLRYDGLVMTQAARTAAGLPVSNNPDLLNVGLNGDIQAYNPKVQNDVETVAFSVGRTFHGLDGLAAYTLQRGRVAGGISEFGTTEGGNGTSSNFYADQTFAKDPNGVAAGKPTNEIGQAFKFNLSYKTELVQGYLSRFTLFAEAHEGRPFSFTMSDPAGGRNPTFGTSRDDALAYVPNLNAADPTNPLKFTSGATTVFFDSQASLNKFKALVSQFNLPMGSITPRGFGRNPWVNRMDFQYSQELPSPVRGNKLIFTADFANLGNLLNRRWGVVKEYTNARAGGALVNVQCADATGLAAGPTSPVCAAYRYSYASVSPTVLATPTVDQIASLFSVEFGLKYKF